MTSSGKGKSKGKAKSKRPVDSFGFEEEPWSKTNEMEPGEWWNSWGNNVKPDRGGAPLGAIVVRGTELGLNSVKTASGEILPDEGKLLWPCFLQDGVHKPLISAGNVLNEGKVAILHSGGGSILSWNSPTEILISRAMIKDPRRAQSDELTMATTSM